MNKLVPVGDGGQEAGFDEWTNEIQLLEKWIGVHRLCESGCLADWYMASVILVREEFIQNRQNNVWYTAVVFHLVRQGQSLDFFILKAVWGFLLLCLRPFHLSVKLMPVQPWVWFARVHCLDVKHYTISVFSMLLFHFFRIKNSKMPRNYTSYNTKK